MRKSSGETLSSIQSNKVTLKNTYGVPKRNGYVSDFYTVNYSLRNALRTLLLIHEFHMCD